MEVVLYQPEIPPNTGNVARLCAAMGVRLNLVEPLGFCLDDKHLRRAGLDYWQHLDVLVHKDWDALLAHAAGRRLVMAEVRQDTPLQDFRFQAEDMLVMGPETSGIPTAILDANPHHVRIPMRQGIRSLNLATSTGIVLFEAMRSAGILPA